LSKCPPKAVMLLRRILISHKKNFKNFQFGLANLFTGKRQKFICSYIRLCIKLVQTYAKDNM
jgi:hypothetical protein